MLHIPNRNLVDETIRNVSARPYVRRRFRLSLVYDTPPDKLDEAIDIVRSAIDEHGDDVNRDEGVNVVFDAFGEHDLQPLAQYYTRSDDCRTAKEAIGRINRTLLRRFDEAGIAFALPSQTTVLESDGERPPVLRIDGGVELSGEVSGDVSAEGERADGNGIPEVATNTGRADRRGGSAGAKDSSGDTDRRDRDEAGVGAGVGAGDGSTRGVDRRCDGFDEAEVGGENCGGGDDGGGGDGDGSR